MGQLARRYYQLKVGHAAIPTYLSNFARGGRGGKVIKVTRLEDSEEPGTLRYALMAQQVLGSWYLIDGYVTVAGQTAPGKVSGAFDKIVRHVRVRPGTSSNESIDGIGMAGSSYCILDRYSMVGCSSAGVTLKGTYTYHGSKTRKPCLIDNEADAGGLGHLPTSTRTTSWDTNDDGIVDWWDCSTDDVYGNRRLYEFHGGAACIYVSRRIGELQVGKLGRRVLEAQLRGLQREAGICIGSRHGGSYTSDSKEKVGYSTATISDDEGSTWERSVRVAIFDSANSIK
ncbi:uncharacterized protein BDW43DRAFT_314167 [Aspergillus alliaceus]|uniref:uncharacterized protein n=1 Tax=Petromyces alliaceus TaxID=209559 RepID=UPI0012A3C417|nr:uncharacterized protein BDW43DRAFT_314167 [Aspergillus alliaceus]KAB8230292.1 hypothetical protein BDW43DRAFT_314167 [Aspergillus alliaceus]